MICHSPGVKDLIPIAGHVGGGDLLKDRARSGVGKKCTCGSGKIVKNSQKGGKSRK